jgi:hypothetical protein
MQFKAKTYKQQRREEKLNNFNISNGQPFVALGDNFTELLTRVDRLPLEITVSIATEYDCPHEFAGIIYLLQKNLGLEPELVVADLKYHLAGDKIDEEGNLTLADSTLLNYAVDEGKWIAYLRGIFPKNLYEGVSRIKKFNNEFKKADENNRAPLATQLLIQKQYYSAKIIEPVITQWHMMHEDSLVYDALINIIAAIKKEPIENITQDEVLNAINELKAHIEELGNTLAESEDDSSWVIRAAMEADILMEEYNQTVQQIGPKGAGALVLLFALKNYEKLVDKQNEKENIQELMIQFQLESDLGFSTATPLATLEYKLLQLKKKPKNEQLKYGRSIIREAWKEYLITTNPVDVGGKILGLFIDYGNLPFQFASKLPRHFEYVCDNYQKDPIRMARAFERYPKRGKLTEKEELEAIILDYLYQFLDNYLIGNTKPDINTIRIPSKANDLELSSQEREIIELIDAGLRRGIRTKDRKAALEILSDILESMYMKALNLMKDEIAVGISILYGILNMHSIVVTRKEAQDLLLKHFKRMNVSMRDSPKKRIDSVVRKAILIEIEEQIIDKKLGIK